MGYGFTFRRWQIRIGWPEMYVSLQHSATRWLRVKGPLGVTIATLLEVGWVPSTSTASLVNLHSAIHITALDFTLALLKEQLSLSIEAAGWRQAASHFAGAGLEIGVELL